MYRFGNRECLSGSGHV
ncbi:hypothetical protein D039_5188A, partial [Vibrio parahaemolyticus EKP-028]